MNLNYNEALKGFNHFFEKEKSLVYQDREFRISKMDDKYVHTMDVVKDGTLAMENLGINKTIQELGKICFLNHDIGRFPQMRLIGNYYDHDLKRSGLFPVDNHGELGEMILTHEMMRKQIPSTSIYDENIRMVVKDHVTSVVPDSDFDILTTTILQNKSLHEIYSSGGENKRQLVSVILQILQDTDRLDIYHQILTDRFQPAKCDEAINSTVWRMFLDGEYLNINNLKESGLWNNNVGELVRLSFINQIRLLSVAQIIYDGELIMKMKTKRCNRYADIAFDIAQDRLEKMIKNSDGVLVDAKRLSLK